ncbi:MAG: hypothetical protein WKG06_31905 [Segetibacter sp.]
MKVVRHGQNTARRNGWTVAKKHNIPTMIDIAADIPPVKIFGSIMIWVLIWFVFQEVKPSVDLKVQDFLLGRKDLIAAARLSAPPRGGNIGRGMKVNKEEILGMYVALDKYVNQDHDKEWKMWEDRVAVIE